LLILSTKQESLSYLSKIPSEYIPFYNEEEVNCQIAKEKMTTGDIY
jgi:hypothetical protein